MEKILEQLAEQLNTTVPYLWEILVQQATYGAWINLMSIAVFLVIAVVLCVLAHRAYTTIRDETDRFLLAVVLVATACVITIVSLVSLPDQINRLLNPEYWALNEIMEMVDKD